MAYGLHICRPAGNPEAWKIPIPLEEWRAALAVMPGVRLYAAKFHTLTDPTTNQVLRFKVNEGDAEVLFPDDGQWYPAFRWSKGSASFNARLEPGDASHPVWAAAVSLAARLNAVIQGDDGEIYDLHTGKPSKRNMDARPPDKLGE